MRVVFFAHNRGDSSVVRRAQAFLDLGVGVLGVMFRRDGQSLLPAPEWPNVDLGLIEHRQHGRRLLVLLRAMRRIFSHRATIRSAHVVYARNLDILLMAFLILLGAKQRPALVYECLDVHDAMTRAGWRSRLLRSVERFLLGKIALLVVSSPGFLRQYFEPLQHFRGPAYLLENKLYFRHNRVERPEFRPRKTLQSGKLTLVWVGILRCQQSLDLLKALALARPEKIAIRLHGQLSTFLIPDFEAQIASIPNIRFEGGYRWPEGLAQAYCDADLVWSQELAWKGANSDWLIPNRVYEASYFGVPSIAVAGSETARLVAERKLGYLLAEASVEALIAFVDAVTPASLDQMRQSLLQRPESDFVQTASDVLDMLECAQRARRTAQSVAEDGHLKPKSGVCGDDN